MKRSLAAATTAALAAVVLVPAGAFGVDQALTNRVTVSGAAPSVVTPTPSPSTTAPSTGRSGNGSSANASPGYGNGGQSGNGTSGNGGFGPWSQMTTSRVSGTPVSSWPGVVMVDTVLPGGEGAGTGIVLTSGGIVLTNYHVVDGSTSVRVKASNGSTYTAKVLGHDQKHDIAVIQLEGASGLKTASLDTSAAVLGEKVTAIGQGGGLGKLYRTGGSVTDTNRQITASDAGSGANAETLHGLLQTNAQIVPGYSGGPLLNSSGQVIGMDTAASSGTPATGYAIPISSAMKIANTIESGTRTSTVHIGARAALGVEISTQSSGPGADVVGIMPGGAAAAAGIGAGSVITGIDGTQVTTANSLTGVLDTAYPGNKATVTWTDAQGLSHTATVTLGSSPEN